MEKLIWNYLESKGFTDYGIAGLMGNLHAESGLKSNNLQNIFEKTLKMNDEQYTKAIDNNTYKNFVNDGAGYGLAQWTFYTRKQALLNFAKTNKKSIGDLNMQLDFLVKELSESYKNVYNILKTSISILQSSNAVLLDFERPANQNTSVQKERAMYGQIYFNKYAGTCP